MQKGTKTTTYSLDWDTVMNLESRLLRDFQTNKTKDRARSLLMISIGVRLGMRVIDNLNLKWEDLLGVFQKTVFPHAKPHANLTQKQKRTHDLT